MLFLCILWGLSFFFGGEVCSIPSSLRSAPFSGGLISVLLSEAAYHIVTAMLKLSFKY